MKTINYVWAMLATTALVLTACSKEENEQQPVNMEAQLNLTIQGTATNTRATGTLPSDEDKITRVTVAVFNSDGTVNVIQEFASSTGITVNCTPGDNCTGLVVANAPEGHFAGISSKTVFEEKVIGLSQTPTELPMSGAITTTDASPSTTFKLDAGKPVDLNAKISRLVARVSIESIKTNFDAKGQYKNATFKLKKVFIHNGNTKSTIAGTGSEAKTGKISTDANYYADFETALGTDETITTSPYTTPYWFYTFQHDENTPTKLVLFGEFDADGTGTNASAEDLYYPVVVNKLQAGTVINDGSNNIDSPDTTLGKGDCTIQPNSQYTIVATIKGKGVSDPDMDINPSIITLNVSVENWKLEITQDVTFN